MRLHDVAKGMLLLFPLGTIWRIPFRVFGRLSLWGGGCVAGWMGSEMDERLASAFLFLVLRGTCFIKREGVAFAFDTDDDSLCFFVLENPFYRKPTLKESWTG